MGGGWERRPLRALLYLPGPILDSNMAFASPMHELSEYFVKFYIRDTDDVTGPAKGQISDNL